MRKYGVYSLFISFIVMVFMGNTSIAAEKIGWEDLIPEGVPYAEIISQGMLDEENDFWYPVFDENGIKLNEELNNKKVSVPGFIVPVDLTSDGITSFLLVPYQGACVHTPPPPPNQIIFATSKKPWPMDENIWSAVWVTGILKTEIKDEELFQIGYGMDVDDIVLYE